MIIENNNTNIESFEHVAIGDVFMLHDTFYMKIEPILHNDITFNAVNISNGLLAVFCDDTMIHYVEGEFVIEKIW